MNRHLKTPLAYLVCASAAALAQTPTGAAGQAAEEEPLELSPFVITSTQEMGYRATSTLAGTRLNTSLKDVGAAVSVYTKEFLDDINVQSIEDILTYTTSTEGGGLMGNYTGITGESSEGARADPGSVNRVRALAQATRTRDFFPSDIPSDTYNFESLTINRGPNAILAGVGNAGGVIDASIRKAGFADRTQILLRYGDENSTREELHFNRVLVPNRVAIRFDFLNKHQQFRQEPTYEKDRRITVGTTIRLREAGHQTLLGRTTLRANFEAGRIEGVPPDQLTPVGSFHSWWGNANPLLDKWSANGAMQQIYNNAGTVVPATGTTAGFPLYRQIALVFADPKSGQAGVGFTDRDLAPIQGFIGQIPGGAQGPGGFLRGTGDPNRARKGFARTRITDRNVFDFYNNLMTGAFDFRQQSFNAADVRVEQLFLGGRAGLEAAYNRQTFENRRDFPIAGGDSEVFIDVNKFLSIRSDAYPNGIPNPNFGRPFIVSRDAFRDQANRSERDAWQANAFYRHDFTREAGWAKWLGKHSLSALVFKTDIERFNRSYRSTWDPTGEINTLAATGAAPGTFAAQVNAWFYIGDSLLNAASPADIRLNPISSSRPRYGETYTVRVYDTVQKRFVTGTSRPTRVLGTMRDQKESIESTAFAVQSHWLKDRVTTLVGWRRDNSEAMTTDDPTTLPDGNVDASSVTYRPASTQAKSSWTKSVVGTYPKRLPFGTELRAYWNDSENFNPVGQRRNIWNEELGSPSASTREYGVMVSLLDGKFDLRVNRYKTKIRNDSISGVGNPYGYISTLIVRMMSANSLGLNPADYGYVHPQFKTFEDVARAFYATIPERMAKNIGPEQNFNPRFLTTGGTTVWEPDTITNYASISDTVSTGTEIELAWNPTNAWRISMGVAKNEAVKSSVAVEELAFAAAWRANLDTMYNGVLLKGWRNPPNESSTFWGQYVSENLASVQVANALSGTRTPEIRKWRANLVTRYDFRNGMLKGIHVGAAARWQDKVGIGYPYVKDADGNEIADTSRPYWGPEEFQLDGSLGYRRKIRSFGKQMDWSLTLNVRNLVGRDSLIPIKANADGSWGTVRIPPYRTWSVTNTFAF